MDIDAMVERAREAKALADDASDGPWAWDRDDGAIEGNTGGAVATIAQHTSTRVLLGKGEDYSHADAALITSCRTDVPALADDVLVLAAEVRRLRGRLEEVCYPLTGWSE